LLQVWEFDKKLLQADALAPVGQFKYEVATIMRALAMDEFLPAVLAAAATLGARGAGESDSAGCMWYVVCVSQKALVQIIQAKHLSQAHIM
jgi:hypothetical protein